MKYTFEGETYSYDKKLTVEEAIEIFEHCQQGVNQLDRALALGHPAAIAAWMHVLMRRAGVMASWDDMLKMDATSFRIVPEGDELREAQQRVRELGKALDEAEEAEAAAQQPAKSTSGKTRKRAT